MQDYDAIVIGSGAGGLASAVALARLGKKVIVYEQHYLPGGWCHTFPLEGFQFSPGVHYIGAMEEGQMMRRLYEGLGVANDMVFCELNPDGFDHVIIGDERFDIPKGVDVFRERLKARFPHEHEGIDGYLDTVSAMHDEMMTLMAHPPTGLNLLKLPAKLSRTLRYGLMSLDRFLDKFTKDPMLRAILSIQAGDHGVPPSRVPVAQHIAVQTHYFDGGYYPMGGARAIPRAFIKALKKHGGELKVETRVARILLEGTGSKRRAVGVRLGDGTEVRAPIVISNADPGITYGKLVGLENCPKKVVRKLDKTTWSVSAISLFMGVECDADAMGLDSGNYRYTRSANIEAAYDTGYSTDLRDLDNLPANFLTVTTLKDRTKLKKPNLHTMESFALVNYDAFNQWAKTEYGNRPDDYERMKERLTESMLRSIDAYMPGLRDGIVFSELGTPMTNEYYVEATHGTMYGTEKVLRQIGPFGWQQKTPFAGLYMCGASTTGHGVAGATMSGLQVAALAAGARLRDFMNAEGQNLRIVPSDDVSAWPDDLKRKVRVGREEAAAE